MENTLPSRVRFGAFELDLRSGELHPAAMASLVPASGDGERNIVLAQQPYRLLLMLVEHEGAILTREEIRKKFWPNDTVVEFDHSINVAIGKLRRALGDSADESQYIETVASRGYRLLVPVEWLADTEDSAYQGEAEVSARAGRVALTQPDPGALTGRTVSHYRVLDIIGGGGMGVVYRAEDLKLGRRVALKFLPEELGDDPHALERFEREARTASALDHPNICAIHEFRKYEGRPFMVMPLLEGQTLRDRLAGGEGPLPLEELLEIGIQVSDGLQAAHERGIIHRDIKPANIFLTKKGGCKILDFGLAKLLETGEQEAGQATVPTQPSDELKKQGFHAVPVPALSLSTPGAESHLTRTGLAMGTAAYMSPEQVRGEKLDARTDLFSFGLVLYEMATGQRAFSGETATLLYSSILNREPIPAKDHNSTLPAQLIAIIDKSLQKDRERRCQSAATMRADLETLKRGRESFTPAQAAEPKPRSWKSFRLTAVALVLLAVAGAFYWFWPPPKVTDVVLADFTNSTTDPVFTVALNTALRVELEQSPFLNLLAPDKVRGMLKLRGHPENEKLTPELAREVCLHTNSKAFVASSIADVGNRYRIELSAQDCETGKTLVRAQKEAAGREEVVKTLGIAGAELRRGLGEPRKSLREFNQPLEQATSSSLEALQAFTEGLEQKRQHGDVAALPYFKRAVELDPKFARAYVSLGIAYRNLAEVEPGVENIRKGYELRDRATQLQRFYIDGIYSAVATGDLLRAVQTFTEWATTYPRDPVAHSNLSAASISLGQYERAAAEARESIRLKPTAAAYFDESSSYLRLDRLDDARRVIEEAQSLNLVSSLLPLARYRLAFLKGDQAALEEQVRTATGKSVGGLLSLQSYTEAFYGRIRKARGFRQQLVELAAHDNAFDTAADCVVANALQEAEIGNLGEARNQAAAALGLSTGRDVQASAALALARAGDVAQAEKLAQQLNLAYPLDTMMQNYSLPTIRAAIELRGNKPAKAIETLTVAVPYELGAGSLEHLYPAYLRGEAYLKAGQGQLAAREFQKILDHPGIMENFVTGALAHLQLGRAQAMMGDKESARQSYQAFLTLWKDADLDVPIYVQAKAEYAKVR